MGHRNLKHANVRPAQYRVGARIKFDFGGHVTEGFVVEDRGNVGAEGAHILRVKVPVALTDESLEFEIRAASVRSAA